MLISAKKYILSFNKKDKNKVFNLFEKFGCFELEEKEEAKEDLEKKLQNQEYLISSTDFVLTFLKPFTKKLSFLQKLKTEKLKQRDTNLNQAKIVGIVEIEREQEVLRKKRKEIEEKKEELSLFGNLDFIPKETEKTISFVLDIPTSKEEEFLSLSKEEGFFQRKLSLKRFLVIASDKNIKEKIFGEKVDYNFSLPVKAQKALFDRELKEIQKKEKELIIDIQSKAQQIEDYKVYRDVLEQERVKTEAQLKSRENGLLGYVIFWAFEKDKKSLIKELPKDTCVIECVTNEEPPVMLENNSTIRPFEYVTEIFGLPKNGEIDPTPYLSFFFFLFFGICITDAGYGLVLAVLCLVGMFLFKGNKLIKLMFYGGISTFLVGIIFGSYFGVSIKAFSRLKLIDPIEDTLLFMGLAFALGYLQLMLAEIVKIISGKKNKNKEMLYNGIAWLFVFIFGIIAMLSIKFSLLKNIGFVGLLISGIFLMISESKGVKVYLKLLVGSVKILQGLIGVMSDILSYSRLMALGLATAVIALIVNQIAGLFSGLIPYVGWVVGGLILIGGHMFNLGINALSGFIHSGRLQFVEFFPKFLEGGGRRFKPLKSELKYIK